MNRAFQILLQVTVEVLVPANGVYVDILGVFVYLIRQQVQRAKKAQPMAHISKIA